MRSWPSASKNRLFDHRRGTGRRQGVDICVSPVDSAGHEVRLCQRTALMMCRRACPLRHDDEVTRRERERERVARNFASPLHRARARATTPAWLAGLVRDSVINRGDFRVDHSSKRDQWKEYSSTLFVRYCTGAVE